MTLSDAAGPRTSLDQQSFDRETLTNYDMGSKTKSYTGKFDFTYDWSGFGSESTLHFGGQYDDRKSVDPGASALIRPDGTVGSFSMREQIGRASCRERVCQKV